MTYVDADALLEDARARHKAVLERANRIRSRQGVETATRDRFVDKSDRPFAFIFDGADPDDVIRDSRAIKKFLDVFQEPTGPRGVTIGTVSTVSLPSGKSFRMNRYTGEVMRP